MTVYQSNQFRYTVIYKDMGVEIGWAPTILDLVEDLRDRGRLGMVAQMHLDMEEDE